MTSAPSKRGRRLSPCATLNGLLLSFALAGSAGDAAAESQPPNPLSQGWRVITMDGNWVSSECLGAFSSPQCIADTVLACRLFTSRGPVLDRASKAATTEKWIEGRHPLCEKLLTSPEGIDRDFLLGDRHVFFDSLGSGPRPPALLNSHEALFYKLVPFGLDEVSQTHLRYRDVVGGAAGDTALAILLINCQKPPDCDFAAEGAKPAGDRYNPSCIRHCQENRSVQALIVRELGPESWAITGWYGYKVGWPYLEAFYAGLWLQQDLR